MANWNDSHGIRLRELDRARGIGAFMPEITINLDSRELAKAMAALKKIPGALQQVICSAIDSARIAARNTMKKKLTSIVTLKPAYVNKGIKSKKAKAIGTSGAEAEIKVATSLIPLIRFDVNPLAPIRQYHLPVKGREKVSYEMQRGNRYQNIAYDAPANASKLFTAKMRSGHLGVFYRVGKRKMVEQKGHSLQYYVKAPGVIPEVSEAASDRFNASFRAEASKIVGFDV